MRKLATKFIATVLVTLALFATTAQATSSDYRINGVWCKPGGGGVGCFAGGTYGVGITKEFVMVMNVRTGKVIFVRSQG